MLQRDPQNLPKKSQKEKARQEKLASGEMGGKKVKRTLSGTKELEERG